MCEFEKPEVFQLWDTIAGGFNFLEPPHQATRQPQNHPSSAKSNSDCACDSDGELLDLFASYQASYTPQQRQGIANQAAKLVYLALAGNANNPIALLGEMIKLALLLSSSPGPASESADFINAIERQFTTIQR